MNDLIEQKAKLFGSLLLFIQVFYKLRTNREFKISQPIGRESHQITICRELTKVFRLETNKLLINVPPGHGKSEILLHFVAWAMAHFPDSQFMYISYSHELASKHTYTIKQIMQLPLYKRLFGVEIKHDSSAKDNFKTIQGGSVKAFGSNGGITGQDSGLPDMDRFSGCTVMDDMHKPDEVHSDTIREKVKVNYAETIEPRPRGINVPTIFIGQRLHQDDLPASFINSEDGYDWRKVILQGLDAAGNALHPTVMPKEKLLILKEKRPYVFSAQQQQDPLPPGGGLFKPEWFIELDDEPTILATFITSDTAETDKTYNDPTVFSFWGIYKVMDYEVDVGLYALHWLDCVELWVEPKDLEEEFNNFYTCCMRYPVKPKAAAIEKKSTGVTLLSILKKRPGLQIIDIERTKASGSKTTRFLEMQPYTSSQRITFSKHSKHKELCVNHMKNITANDTHRFDDICDTAYDAVKLGLIDQVIYFPTDTTAQEVTQALANKFKQRQNAKARSSWHNR